MASEAVDLKEFNVYASNFPVKEERLKKLLTLYGDMKRMVSAYATSEELCTPEHIEYLILTCRFANWMLSGSVTHTARPLWFKYAGHESNCIWYDIIARTHDTAAGFLALTAAEEKRRDPPQARRVEQRTTARYLVGLLRFCQKVAFPEWKDAPALPEQYNRAYGVKLYTWCRAFTIFTLGMTEEGEEGERNLQVKSGLAHLRVKRLYTARYLLSDQDTCLRISKPGVPLSNNSETLKQDCNVPILSCAQYDAAKNKALPRAAMTWCDKLDTEFMLAASEYFMIVNANGNSVAMLRLAKCRGRSVPLLDKLTQENDEIHHDVVSDAKEIIASLQDIWLLPADKMVVTGDNPLHKPDKDAERFF